MNDDNGDGSGYVRVFRWTKFILQYSMDIVQIFVEQTLLPNPLIYWKDCLLYSFNFVFIIGLNSSAADFFG